jgi:hypothetical protein
MVKKSSSEDYTVWKHVFALATEVAKDIWAQWKNDPKYKDKKYSDAVSKAWKDPEVIDAKAVYDAAKKNKK